MPDEPQAHRDRAPHIAPQLAPQLAPQHVAIIGAGIAGLSCALRLQSAGVVVTLVDKGRQAGGRVCTRLVGDLRFDHGLRFLTEGRGFASRAGGGDAASILHAAMVPWRPQTCMGRSAPMGGTGDDNDEGHQEDHDVQRGAGSFQPSGTVWVGAPHNRALVDALVEVLCGAGSLQGPADQRRMPATLMLATRVIAIARESEAGRLSGTGDGDGPGDAAHAGGGIGDGTKIVAPGMPQHEAKVQTPAWRLMLDNGHRPGPFDAVLVTAPGPQAFALLEGHTSLSETIKQVSYRPRITALVALDQPLPGEEDLWIHPCGSVAWVCREDAKPGRGPRAETMEAHSKAGSSAPRTSPFCYVLHATDAWSLEHLEADPDESARRLWREFSARFDLRHVDVSSCRGHRWRYAEVEKGIDAPCLWDENATLGFAGDACAGPGMWAAVKSGHALAERIMGSSLST